MPNLPVPQNVQPWTSSELESLPALGWICSKLSLPVIHRYDTIPVCPLLWFGPSLFPWSSKPSTSQSSNIGINCMYTCSVLKAILMLSDQTPLPSSPDRMSGYLHMNYVFHAESNVLSTLAHSCGPSRTSNAGPSQLTVFHYIYPNHPAPQGCG